MRKQDTLGAHGHPGTPADRQARVELICEEIQRLFDEEGLDRGLAYSRAMAAAATAFPLKVIKVVAYECPHCGAPVGRKDYDDPDVDEVRARACSDCY